MANEKIRFVSYIEKELLEWIAKEAKKSRINPSNFVRLKLWEVKEHE